MQNAKPIATPLANHFRLTKEMCPRTQGEIASMSSVPYASAVGSLMYAMVWTRLDIAHAVGVVSRYMENPGEEHWTAMKNIMKYLRRTKDLFLVFGGDSELNFEGYSDADFMTDLDDRRSTSEHVFLYNNGVIS